MTSTAVCLTQDCSGGVISSIGLRHQSPNAQHRHLAGVGRSCSRTSSIHVTSHCCLLQGAIVAVEAAGRKLFGLQYHPEVQHSERGTQTLKHFLQQIAKLPADWKIEQVLEEEMQKIRQLVSNMILQSDHAT